LGAGSGGRRGKIGGRRRVEGGGRTNICEPIFNEREDVEIAITCAGKGERGGKKRGYGEMRKLK